MRKYKIVRTTPARDAYANYPYKKCGMCGADLVTELGWYTIHHLSCSANPYLVCSEACTNMFMLQDMDRPIGVSGYYPGWRTGINPSDNMDEPDPTC